MGLPVWSGRRPGPPASEPGMFGLSRKTEYALIALARLARGEGERPAVPARALAAADELPAALLSGVLKRLQQAGVLASKRGSRGGYYLADAPEAIRLADVIAAIEGPEPLRLTPCCEQDEPTQPGEKDGHEHDGCPIMCRCPITGAIRGLNHRMHSFLQQLTLADLLEEQKTEARSEKREDRR